MGRLPLHLCRYFRIAPTATAADLRQAYLQRAKQVHPDIVGAASPGEFQELQRKFQKACEVLETSADIPDHGWSSSSSSSFGARYGWDNASSGQSASSAFHGGSSRQAAEGVPTVGLPHTPVYGVVGAILVSGAAASFLLMPSERRPSPTSSNKVVRNNSQARERAKEAASAPAPRSFPPLERGPWNVADAIANPVNRVWAPSRRSEFLDSDSFLQGRAKGHIRAGIGQRRTASSKQGGQIKDLGYEANHQPQVRDGVEILPIHAAAQDGHVWWLENCGADKSCRGMLDIGDTMSDTPLHHSAKTGQHATCKALLRMGANPAVRNSTEMLAEESAAKGGHAELASLLRAARDAVQSATPAMCTAERQHADGIGVLAEPPEEVVFTGLDKVEKLRRAVNMAAGFNITPPVPVSQSAQSCEADRADHIANVVRGSLLVTDFDLEDIGGYGAKNMEATLAAVQQESFWTHNNAAAGLLVYEPPGEVSADAPGHWVAVRRRPTINKEESEFWRLDPVRGPFRLNARELQDLVKKYRAWKVVQGAAH